MLIAAFLALVAQSPPPLAVSNSPAPPAATVPPLIPQLGAPRPPVPIIVRPPQSRHRLQALVSPADYPASALRLREQGRVTFRLDVGANGRVTQCVINGSSGSAALDSATCRLMRTRARFTPAMDSNGMPASGSVHDTLWWILPQAPGAAPEITVFTGPRDPRYALPQRVREQARLESERRRLAATRFQAEARPLLARIEADPRFGGIIFRDLPEPHALVMFTGDAEARLRHYTRDPRFRAHSVELTLAELERMKDETSAQLSRLGLRCYSVDGDEAHNSVTVGAPPGELAKIHDAIAAGRLRAPGKLRLVEQGCAEFR